MPNCPQIKFSDDEKGGTTKRKKKKWLLYLLTAFFICLFLYGSINLAIYLKDLISSVRISKELSSIHQDEPTESIFSADADDPAKQDETIRLSQTDESYRSEESASLRTSKDGSGTCFTLSAYINDLLPFVTYPDNNPPVIQERFLKLCKKSKYIIGWLTAGKIIDEAVAQKDNRYFLKRDINGNKNGNGCVFLDENIVLRTRPYTFILYGHNMKSGTMFGNLHKYKDSSFFYKNRIIQFDTIYEDGKYIVFSAGDISLEAKGKNYLDPNSLLSTSRTRRKEAIATLEKNSVLGNIIDVQPEDQLLLLITCNGDNSTRTFVAARRLRENESEESPVIKSLSSIDNSR